MNYIPSGTARKGFEKMDRGSGEICVVDNGKRMLAGGLVLEKQNKERNGGPLFCKMAIY